MNSIAVPEPSLSSRVPCYTEAKLEPLKPELFRYPLALGHNQVRARARVHGHRVACRLPSCFHRSTFVSTSGTTPIMSQRYHITPGLAPFRL